MNLTKPAAAHLYSVDYVSQTEDVRFAKNLERTGVLQMDEAISEFSRWK